jgi:hypothetical protein
MKNELIEKITNEENPLLKTLELSRATCLAKYEKKKLTSNFMKDVNFRSGYVAYRESRIFSPVEVFFAVFGVNQLKCSSLSFISLHRLKPSLHYGSSGIGLLDRKTKE